MQNSIHQPAKQAVMNFYNASIIAVANLQDSLQEFFEQKHSTQDFAPAVDKINQEIKTNTSDDLATQHQYASILEASIIENSAEITHTPLANDQEDFSRIKKHRFWI